VSRRCKYVFSNPVLSSSADRRNYYLSVAVLPLSQSKGRSMSHYLIAFNFQQWNTPILATG